MFRGKKKLYVAFIDLKKAYDTVWRDGLFLKMLKLGIGGKLFQVIENLYSKTLVSVKLSDGMTSYFSTNTGVKQGCVLSPALFNIYVNDIPEIFTDDCEPPLINNNKIGCLMFADDIAILSTSPIGLQLALTKLHNYCNEWNLKLNTKKTKIMIFNKGGRKILTHKFYIGNEDIEIVSQFCYLGVTMMASGLFNVNCVRLREKATKASYKIKKVFLERPDVKTGIKCFESMVKPVLLYGSEVWGMKVAKMKFLEVKPNVTKVLYQEPFLKCQLNWCKYILGVNSKACNNAVLAELGQYPLELDIYINMIKYWVRLKSLNHDSLLKITYEHDLEESNQGITNWVSTVKLILQKIGMEHLWQQRLTNKSIKEIQAKLRDNFENQWNCELFNDKFDNPHEGNKLRTYRKIKFGISLEPYLNLIKDKQIRAQFTKLRISAHNLKIETGRHNKPNKIPLSQRICMFEQCTEKVEDEYHMVMECNRFNEKRKEIMNKLFSIYPFLEVCDRDVVFWFLLQGIDADICGIVSDFLKHVCEARGAL